MVLLEIKDLQPPRVSWVILAMIDTLKLKSPAIDEETAFRIEQHLVQRQAVDMLTGEELYCLCSGSLEGSWSSSVAVNVLRKDFKTFEPLRPGQKSVTELVESPPYVTIEGSVHKAMLGHNVFGGPERLGPAVAWLVADVARRLGVQLPPWSEWELRRVDIAEVYDVGNFEGCAQYLHGLGLARYPRRKKSVFGDETVMFPGTTTTLKFYHKGPEFAKNGYKLMAKAFSDKMAEKIQRVANCYLRVESSIKSKKLTQVYGVGHTAGTATLLGLNSILDRDVAAVLREAEHDMKTVRTTEEVRARLHEVYEPRLAKLLFGTWLELAAIGEDAVRRSTPKMTYYRHRSQLAQAGIAWDATDVYIREQSFIPAGFRPIRSDPRRISGECLEVKELLMPYALA
jgi:hypothetical protein